MQPLLRKCLLENDADAWVEVWLLFMDVVHVPVRQLLLQFGFCFEDVEDVEMEIARRMFVGQQCKLREFRGQTRGQLCCFFALVATNFARDWMKHQLRAKRVIADYQASTSEYRHGTNLRFTAGGAERFRPACHADVGRLPQRTSVAIVFPSRRAVSRRRT